jgi:hypothetical protein
MKCQTCDQPATHHITEIVAGKPVEYHLCETHLNTLEHLPDAPRRVELGTKFGTFWNDPMLCRALHDPAVTQEMAAHLLPALCLALLHQKPEVRIAAVFYFVLLGCQARSAAGALRDALQDSDERVAKAAGIALDYIESNEARPWF